MAHTLPDFSTKYRMSTVFGNIDDAELAARLGSIVNFDRAGNVVWLDDFEAPTLKWDTSSSQNEGAVTLSALYPFLGSQCVKFYTTNNAASHAYMERTIHFPQNVNLGFQYNFTTPTNKGTIETYIKVYTGSWDYEFGFNYNTSDDKLYIYSIHGEYNELVDTVSLKVGAYTYNTIKLVIDLTEGSYRRLLLNNHTYPLTTSYGTSSADSTDAYILVRTRLIGHATGVNTFYLDNYVVTQNEY